MLCNIRIEKILHSKWDLHNLIVRERETEKRERERGRWISKASFGDTAIIHGDQMW